jgi:protein phosphatase
MARFHARTDVGLKRRQNEDALLALEEFGLYVVADGVGGRKAGELASALTIDTFQTYAPRLKDMAEQYGVHPTRESASAVLNLLEEAANVASNRVYDTASNTGREGMTSTLVVLLLGGGAAFVGHVGDSRAYLVRDGELRQVTEDHSLVNEMLRNGGMTQEEASSSRYKHVITRAVGLYPHVHCDTTLLELVEGDRFILCSDGLSDMVKPARIGELAATADVTQAVESLVDAALQGGGKDNITTIGVDAVATRDAVAVTARARAMEGLFLFQDLPYQARLRVGRIFSERRVQAGETVVRQGDAGDVMYVVVLGTFSVTVNQREVATLRDGEAFGELALVDDIPRSATVVARQPGWLLCIERDALRAWCAVEPGIGNRILWRLTATISQRLRQANDRLAGWHV